MKMNYKFLPIFLLLFINGFAQIGIGTVTPEGALDITSGTNGMLVPRVALTSTLISAPVINPLGTPLAQGTLVWNNATVGTPPNNVIPGFYYWNGTIWVSLAGSSANAWTLAGNGGTTAGANYIGTTDAQNLQLRTDGLERLTIGSGTGNVAIGTSVIPATTRLEVSSGATNDAISGHSNNVGGVLGKEVNITFGTPAQTLFGSGVYANNPTPGYTSSFAQSTGTATVAANISFSDIWIANYNYVQNPSPTKNPPALYGQLNVSDNTLAGNQVAVSGYSNRGTISGNPGYTIGMSAAAVAQSQDSYGIQGLAFSNSAMSYGGYFSGYNYTPTVAFGYAYIGGTNNGATSRKVTGVGSVAEIIPTENHGRITLLCPESPEYWYQDYGTVQMVNGKATIKIDAILADIIVVDDDNPLRVICTPVGMPYFNGITIMSQTKNSVDILELNGGNHSGKLQYQLVAKPKTNYGEGRFPQAPGPAYLKANREPMAAKAQNQPGDGRKIFHWPSDPEVYKYNPEDIVSIGDVIPAGPHAGKIKLANGKYGEGLPAEDPTAKKK